jgi:F0F1-type ATP synthase assembly protein I
MTRSRPGADSIVAIVLKLVVIPVALVAILMFGIAIPHLFVERRAEAESPERSKETGSEPEQQLDATSRHRQMEPLASVIVAVLGAIAAVFTVVEALLDE